MWWKRVKRTDTSSVIRVLVPCVSEDVGEATQGYPVCRPYDTTWRARVADGRLQGYNPVAAGFHEAALFMQGRPVDQIECPLPPAVLFVRSVWSCLPPVSGCMPRKRPMSELLQTFPTPYSRMLALWVLRIFSPSLGRRHFMQASGYREDEIAEFLGLPASVDASSAPSIGRKMDDMCAQLESAGGGDFPAELADNISRFGDVLGLNRIEKAITGFFVCREFEMCLDDSLRLTSHMLACKPERFLSKVLCLHHEEVVKALGKSGKLMRGGILKWTDRYSKHPNLRFFSSEVAGNFGRESYDHSRILASMGVAECPSSGLDIRDYPHLEEDLSVLVPYLKHVCSTGKPGVNILLHGKPGTGKTQLTRVLAKAVGLPLFDFVTVDCDGDPMMAENRLAAVRIAESFFREAPALFVFDELEDVITPTLRDQGAANARKGWFNRLLENNLRPIFWLSNSIRTLDPAFVRRFDFVIELPVPPKLQLEKILQREAGGLLSPQAIDRLSRIDHLSPAIINRASCVIASVEESLPAEKHEEAFTRIVSGVLKAQGYPDACRPLTSCVPAGVYDVTHLNASVDLPAIAATLKGHPSARICLHGPPGTGKTAFGHWLAGEIGRPLLVKRASDLLDAFVGRTEQQIAGAFDQARRDGAVLMIDEVDSFLMDRSKSVRSWEVTQVNEMLTRIETFDGVLIASTNRLEHMDAASLRRFDLKIHLGFLLPEQVFQLLSAWCRSLSISPPDARHLKTAKACDSATPGDFATVARRHRFHPFEDAEAFLDALLEECCMKTANSRVIGFR